MQSPTYKKIWTIAAPIMVSLIMEHMINLTDTAFLGRVGEVELGASALAGVYYMAIFMLGFGFSTGSQILIARRNGEGNYAAIGGIVVQGGLFLCTLAAVMFVLTRLFSPMLLHNLIASEHVYAAAIQYMDWRVYGFFFAFVALIFRAFFVGITSTRILTVNSVVMVSTNVVLNYLLIFGKGGFPAMGIAGAAIASSLSELVSLLFYLLYVWQRVNLDKYGLRAFKLLDIPLIKNLLNLSVWTMLQYFINVSIWFLFFIAVEHLGERAIAISNIVRSVATLLLLPLSAFAAATSTLVSNLIGAGLRDEVIPTCWKIIRLSYVLLLPLLCALVLFPALAIRIYTDNPDLVRAAIPALLVMASAQIIAVPGCIFFNAVSGTGNTRTAMCMDLLVISIYSLYCYIVVVVLKLDVALCWTTEHAYWIPLCACGYWYMTKARWGKRRI